VSSRAYDKAHECPNCGKPDCSIRFDSQEEAEQRRAYNQAHGIRDEEDNDPPSMAQLVEELQIIRSLLEIAGLLERLNHERSFH
jgi:hypothetical protein